LAGSMNETSRAFFRRLFLIGPSIEACTSGTNLFSPLSARAKKSHLVAQRGNSPVAHQRGRSMSALSIIVGSWLVLNAFVIVARDQPRAGSKDVTQTPLNMRRK
jgi:hypothetical protein